MHNTKKELFISDLCELDDEQILSSQVSIPLLSDHSGHIGIFLPNTLWKLMNESPSSPELFIEGTFL